MKEILLVFLFINTQCFNKYTSVVISSATVITAVIMTYHYNKNKTNIVEHENLIKSFTKTIDNKNYQKKYIIYALLILCTISLCYICSEESLQINHKMISDNSHKEHDNSIDTLMKINLDDIIPILKSAFYSIFKVLIYVLILVCTVFFLSVIYYDVFDMEWEE